MNNFWKHATTNAGKLVQKLNPQHNRGSLMALLLTLLLVGQIGFAFAQGSGIPIIDQILDLIDQYKLGLAMIGIAVVALGLLARPVAPEWSANNRSAIASMVIGGILLTLLPTIAIAIVGS
jgi:hypothetical protein